MERTTIMLDKLILERIRERARQRKQTLRKTMEEIILEGLNRPQASPKNKVDLPTFNLGAELVDISDRSRLYELWDKDK